MVIVTGWTYNGIDMMHIDPPLLQSIALVSQTYHNIMYQRGKPFAHILKENKNVCRIIINDFIARYGGDDFFQHIDMRMYSNKNR